MGPALQGVDSVPGEADSSMVMSQSVYLPLENHATCQKSPGHKHMNSARSVRAGFEELVIWQLSPKDGEAEVHMLSGKRR